MKKVKELGKKNEGKVYKKEMTKENAAKIITKEINSRSKLNQADSYLQKKKKKEIFIGKLKNYSKQNIPSLFTHPLELVRGKRN
jgi:predicted Ser/Thr protein kinase